MKRAAVVMVGNQYLAEYARRAGAEKIVEVPTVVDPARYAGPSPPRSGGTFRIGWIGTPSTTRFLSEIAGPIRELAARRLVQFIAVGARNPVMPGVPLDVRQWREVMEVRDIQSFDVGVMPLADEPFTRGKCGYKLIQYMAAGLPTVASPTGVNATIVEDGQTGFLARTPMEWLEGLDTLASDVALRAQLGKAGREKVVRQYSLEGAVPAVEAALRYAAR
jgi:glycosyltransferase involved in cell wall biosynthesis